MTRSNEKLKTVYFVSLGCPKNRVDTEVMAGVLTRDGLTIVGDPAQADVIVVNTCSFVGDAREESVDSLLEMATWKTEGRCRMLVAAGCLPQRSGAEVAQAMPEIDAFVSTSNPDEVGAIIRGENVRTELNTPGHFLQRPETPRFIESGRISAYVKISDGCSRKCAFCAIPAIRGKAQSRPIDEIVAEVRSLGEKGIVEVVLVSQDTAAYGRDRDDGANLTALVQALDQIESIRWVRLLYLYPDDITDELLHALAGARRVLPYLDIPIQHASAAMLKAMRRGHGPKDLHHLLTRIHRILPGAWLRTTVLVGHPGETEADVDELIRFIETARFDHLGAFRYSDEEGTASYKKEPRVSSRDSYNRWRRVMAAQRRVVEKKNRALIGRTVQVLVEDAADASGFVLTGRHGGQAPEIDGITYLTSSAATPGQLVEARITDVRAHDLVAEPINPDFQS